MPTSQENTAKSPAPAGTRWPWKYIVLSAASLTLPLVDGLSGRLLVGEPTMTIPERDANGYYRPMPVSPSVRTHIIWMPSSGNGGGYQGGK
jgi:hypothetical protein